MQTIRKVDRFIDAKKSVKQNIAAAFPQPGSAPFVTISRELGAGGTVLAEALPSFTMWCGTPIECRPRSLLNRWLL